jgi:hypothetical protein
MERYLCSGVGYVRQSEYGYAFHGGMLRAGSRKQNIYGGCRLPDGDMERLLI